MHIASLLFGISASLDALLGGMAYGIRQVRILPWQNLAISLVTLLGTCLSVGLGHRLAALLPGSMGLYAGSLVLILLGLYYISKWAMALLRGRSAAKAPAQTTNYREQASGPVPCLHLSEVLTLSLTLSLNNLSAGLSASLAGLALVPTAVATLACSVLFLSCGNRLGSHPTLGLAGRAADPLSGALLIGLGMVQLFL